MSPEQQEASQRTTLCTVLEVAGAKVRLSRIGWAQWSSCEAVPTVGEEACGIVISTGGAIACPVAIHDAIKEVDAVVHQAAKTADLSRARRTALERLGFAFPNAGKAS